MRKLYEIDDDIAKLIEIDADRYVDGETGEIVSKEAFEALQVEREKKIEGVALGYKNEDAEAKAIKAEIDKLTERMKIHQKRAEGYKQFLAWVLEGAKFETAKCKLSYRKTSKVGMPASRRMILAHRPTMMQGFLARSMMIARWYS